jgi:equilibrative nucleoside transporter 1/2/3
MFLAAAPYFQSRFKDDTAILNHFQSAITSVGCITNLTSMIILANLQAKASYPRRILFGLAVNIAVFTLLSISTSYFRGASEPQYLAFTLTMVFLTMTATGLIQNGAFAFASSFGRPEYTKAILLGQGIAGVLPSGAGILSVLALPVHDNWADPEEQAKSSDSEAASSAFIYFLTATGVSVFTMLAVFPLIRKHNRILENQMLSSVMSVEEIEQSKRKTVGMWTLYKKLHWLAAGVFICFAVTMFFPVFTGKIVSIVPEDQAPRLFQPAAFIPLGFFFWNLGDFSGRSLTYFKFPFFSNRPWLLFIISILRGGHLPLYLLCNIEGKGAAINSDAFYLLIVQFGFGLTNGWLCSMCMTDAFQYVDDNEREATGSFMPVNLVAGLTAGSLLSFAVTKV